VSSHWDLFPISGQTEWQESLVHSVIYFTFATGARCISFINISGRHSPLEISTGNNQTNKYNNYAF